MAFPARKSNAEGETPKEHSYGRLSSDLSRRKHYLPRICVAAHLAGQEEAHSNALHLNTTEARDRWQLATATKLRDVGRGRIWIFLERCQARQF